jgi:MFS family permease
MSHRIQRRGDVEMLRHLGRNFTMHTVEGGLFIGALALLNENTVLPSMVRSLGGPDWLTSLTPVLPMIGFALAPICTAHLIERAEHFKPLCLVTGILQRLPYLVVGLMLCLLAGGWPVLILAAVGLAPLISSLAGGLTLTAWQQLVMKTIPVRRRPMLFGLRDIIGCLLGIVAGLVVKWTLDTWPGPTGYGLLYLMVFAVLAASYAVFAGVHECGRHPPVPERRTTLGENLRIIPSLLRADRRYTRYLIAGMLVNGLLIMMPFLAIHAREVTGEPEGFIGELVVATMIGAVIGNLTAGQVSARVGCKPAVIGSRVLLIAAALWPLAASASWEFLGIFFLYGVGNYGHRTSNGAMGLELCPRERRSMYLSIMALVGVPSMLTATGLSALVRATGADFAVAAGLSALVLAASIWVLLPLREPERQAAAHAT